MVGCSSSMRIHLGFRPLVTLSFLFHHIPACRLELVSPHRLSSPHSSDHSPMVRMLTHLIISSSSDSG